MTTKNYEPDGPKWRDDQTGRMVCLVHGGEWDGWLCYQHPCGQWVSLRQLTSDEAAKIQTQILAMCKQPNDVSQRRAPATDDRKQNPAATGARSLH